MTRFFIIFAAVLPGIMFSLSCGKMPPRPTAVLVWGEVTLQKSIGSISTLNAGEALSCNDEISTGGDSFCAVQVREDVMVTLDRAGALTLLKNDGSTSCAFKLERGSLYFRQAKDVKKESCLITAGPLTLRASVPATFSLLKNQGGIDIIVASGEVDAAWVNFPDKQKKKQKITAGSHFTIKPGVNGSKNRIKIRKAAEDMKTAACRAWAAPFFNDIEKIKDIEIHSVETEKFRRRFSSCSMKQ